MCCRTRFTHPVIKQRKATQFKVMFDGALTRKKKKISVLLHGNTDSLTDLAIGEMKERAPKTFDWEQQLKPIIRCHYFQNGKADREREDPGPKGSKCQLVDSSEKNACGAPTHDKKNSFSKLAKLSLYFHYFISTSSLFLSDTPSTGNLCTTG